MSCNGSRGRVVELEQQLAQSSSANSSSRRGKGGPSERYDPALFVQDIVRFVHNAEGRATLRAPRKHLRAVTVAGILSLTAGP